MSFDPASKKHLRADELLFLSHVISRSVPALSQLSRYYTLGGIMSGARAIAFLILVGPMLLLGCTPAYERKQTELGAAQCEYRTGSAEGALILIGNTLLAQDELRYRGIYIANGVIGEIDRPELIVKKYPRASQLRCQNTFFSPGLINAHEHTSYSHQFPSTGMAHDYQHREEWNRGGKREMQPESKRTDDVDELIWVELRHLFSGVTTLVGSGQVDGLIKNISTKYSADFPAVDLMTFPFTVTELDNLRQRCLGEQTRRAVLSFADNLSTEVPYVPHVGEGINCLAEQELNAYLAYANENPVRKYSLIHGVMIAEQHYQLLKSNQVTVIWSPRSNVALYGKSLDPVPLLEHGISVALGTDWSPSGSYNMFEEMRCAKAVTEANSARPVTDAELWLMATSEAAIALGVADKVGVIAPGKIADIIVVADTEHQGLARFSSKTAEDILAVLVDGRLTVGARENVRGEWIDQACTAHYGDKFICIDFEKDYHQSFAAIVQKNSANVDLLALDGQASCELP